MKNLAVCAILLLLSACDRPTDPPIPTSHVETRSTVIISGFNDVESAVVDRKGYRVGSYHNFRPYDSLWITFTATRMTSIQSSDPILIKIGPTANLRHSIANRQQYFSISVRPAEIAKPNFAALTFIVPDSGVSLLLSNLRVVGWTTDGQ